MRALGPLSVIIGLSSGGACAQSAAERMAALSGELIGASEACGVAHDRLVKLGQIVIGHVREAAKSGAEIERARLAHEAAVSRMAWLAGRNKTDRACKVFETAFDRVERACLSPRVSSCLAEIAKAAP